MMTPSSKKTESNVFAVNYHKMRKNTAVLCVICILLCFNLNYTFPYIVRRNSSDWHLFRGNHSHYCAIVDRTKKMAADIENALKTMRGDTKDDIQHRKARHENTKKDDDLSHFEQMVIMKKNPYLDLKELTDQKYYNTKTVRQSVAGSIDPGICEPAVEGPYVEITNRGLTGFAIPVKMVKAALAITTAKDNTVDKLKLTDNIRDAKIIRKTDYDDRLTNLAKDIKKFEESKLVMSKNQLN